MADAERNVILVDLDKPRRIDLNLNALIELSETFGVEIEALGKALVPDKKPDLKALRTFLWIGLKQEDAELTEDQVGRIVGLLDLAPLSRDLVKFFNALAGKEPELAAVLEAVTGKTKRAGAR
ncbi:MAG TPA: hypothetical protein VGK74_02750 [Symbiobacteriaceae bacterium]|jgi:hypothetical protein